MTLPPQVPPSHFKPGRTSKKHERHYVIHCYHDFANEPDDPSKTPIRRRKGGVNIPFPIILHRVIARVEADGYSHIFGWQPHGRAFLIREPKEFNDFILPKYFQQNKLTSFQRQLNLYGFNRLTRGLDATGYYHEYFLRDREYLAKRMMRQRIKGTKIKGAASPEAEPDFYAMPVVGPTADASLASTTASKQAPLVDQCSGASQEPPVVSSDDMSHESSLDERDGGNPESSLTVDSDSRCTSSSQQEGTFVIYSASQAPETHALALPATVPSMTDYKPLSRSVSAETTAIGKVEELLDTSDPADAFLMDLHRIDPLDEFSFGMRVSSTTGTTTTSTASSNIVIQEIGEDEDEENALRAMEEDEVLSQMLHHVLEECETS